MAAAQAPAPAPAPVPAAPRAPATTPPRNAARAPGHKRGVSKPSPIPAPPQPQTPPPPLTPEQMPPAPPQVTYSNGLLTIVATNSTLSDILRAVAARTGATVDAPAQLTSERVAANIGPGTPREVLSNLLNGPHFDYILVGSNGDPNGVRSIILTPNHSSPSPVAAMPQSQPARTPPQEETDEEVGEEQQTPPLPQPPQPTQQFQPMQRPFTPQLPPEQVGPGGQPQVKTPEQLLEQLRRLQQQQGNQQQNPPQR